MAGKLIICPTPIGNLATMTERARGASGRPTRCALRTRVTGKPLAAFRIENAHRAAGRGVIGERASLLVERVAAGEVITYCSDASMPGVSDPGAAPYRALPARRACRWRCCGRHGHYHRVRGWRSSADPRFYFGGFFPRKGTPDAAPWWRPRRSMRRAVVLRSRTAWWRGLTTSRWRETLP